MTWRMSCSMTIGAVKDRTKTVTRRHVDTWKNLKIGDRLTLIEKGMGLPKGSRQVVLAEVEVVSVDVIPIGQIDTAEVRREGFADMSPAGFVKMWLNSHGYKVEFGCNRIPCRRIEWRYLDG